ncbi:hypothetical protein ACROYT_G014680 [Oculina patagonica]
MAARGPSYSEHSGKPEVKDIEGYIHDVKERSGTGNRFFDFTIQEKEQNRQVFCFSPNQRDGIKDKESKNLFNERGRKTGEPGEKPSEQGENQQQTQPTYGTGPESNPGHIGGRRALSPLRHPCSPDLPLESQRKYASKDILMCHLNINSIQNQFEELAATIKKIGAHIAFISETKIEASYPDAQFSIPGYALYQNDRKKGGGGIMALVSPSLTKKRLKPGKHYKTLKLLALEVKTDAGNIIILGIYRPPRALCGNYRLLLENELSDVCNWASLQSNSVVVTGDLNLDTLRSDKTEGKVLLDLENEQGFECLITKPTQVEMRGTKVTKTLLDVLLSNKPELLNTLETIVHL